MWMAQILIQMENPSQENIFKPLGMTNTSFYLTPELKAKLINLTIPSNGKFELFMDHAKVIEQEPSKGKRLAYYSFPILSDLPFLRFSK
jgi:hypothetical protein